MSKEFRNSFFGFNRNDVLSFVYESQENSLRSKQTIEELQSKVSDLEDKVKEVTLLQEQTVNILKETEKQLDSYKQREESLTKLSESIGRLYLVAQANADSIVSSANDSIEKSKETVERSIAVASSAESELAEIGDMLNNKTAAYIDEITKLKQQLAAAKERIAENNADIVSRKAELAAVTAGADK